jgi:hypothetical protein
MVEISRVAYGRVAAGVVPSAPVLREINDGVNAFLADHIRALKEMTESRRTQAGSFTDPSAQDLFRSLLYDEEPGFLAAADTLTKRLFAAMDHRTKPGLLICVSATDESNVIAGVLKLEVAAKHGAVLERLDTGEEVLSAVTDMLDRPGDLQKGALVSSGLADNQVMTGDRLIPDAAYFPNAFGIQIYSRPSQGAGQLLDVVAEAEPDLAPAVAASLPSIPSGGVHDVLAALGQQVPGLTRDVQATVADALAHRPRPVGMVDTSKTSTMRIKIGDITISGPTASMLRNTRVQGPAVQGWQVVVAGTEEPKTSYRTA